MNPDKRRFPRFEVGLNAGLRTEDDIFPISVPIQDASKEGLKLSIKKHLSKESHVHCEITLPGELVPILVEGDVKWCDSSYETSQTTQTPQKEHNCGVQLSRIDPFDRSRLLDFVYEKWLHTQQS
jgi:c-di-GMP-binding flagellar brake protein YcgR